MDNLETQATSGTQDTKQNKHTIQKTVNMSNVTSQKKNQKTKENKTKQIKRKNGGCLFI